MHLYKRIKCPPSEVCEEALSTTRSTSCIFILTCHASFVRAGDAPGADTATPARAKLLMALVRQREKPVQRENVFSRMYSDQSTRRVIHLTSQRIYKRENEDKTPTV